MSDVLRCPECGKEAPAGTQFCPACGSPLAALAAAPDTPVVEYMRTEPRLFGVLPPVLTLAIAVALFALGLASLAIGSWIIGTVLVVLSIPLALAGIAALGREDHAHPLVRAIIAAPSRGRAWAAFAGRSVSVWTETGRELVRLRTELHGLRARRKQLQFSLGDAAYREEHAKMENLRANMREVDDEVEACERRIVAAKKRARRQVERRRMTIRPTRQLR